MMLWKPKINHPLQGKFFKTIAVCFVLVLVYLAVISRSGYNFFNITETSMAVALRSVSKDDGYITNNTSAIRTVSEKVTKPDDIISFKNVDNAMVKINKIYLPPHTIDSNSQLERTKNHEILSDKKIIIILAYMRTGSTLTASVFQEYPGSFYVFEPIRFLYERFTSSRDKNDTSVRLEYTHGRTRNFTFLDMNKVVMEEINSWLTCRLDAINMKSLTDEFHRHFTKLMKNFYRCAHVVSFQAERFRTLRLQPRLRKYFDLSEKLDNCLKTTIKSCLNSPAIILKFIRLKLEEIEKLLPLYPNLKIIHLVRDPRGIMNSRIRLKTVSSRSFQQEVQTLCTDMFDNLRNSRNILENFPNRLKFIFYEDIAERPEETVKEMVEFTGLEFTPQMQTFIREQTNSLQDSCPYCTQRKDSKTTANKWRQELLIQHSKYIYQACRENNAILGYVPFSSYDSQANLTNSFRMKVDVNSNVLSYGKF